LKEIEVVRALILDLLRSRMGNTDALANSWKKKCSEEEEENMDESESVEKNYEFEVDNKPEEDSESQDASGSKPLKRYPQSFRKKLCANPLQYINKYRYDCLDCGGSTQLGQMWRGIAKDIQVH